jgi:energy-coupling factor transporter transmembrane protein EcfT
MLTVPPIARLLSAALFIAGIFVARTLLSMTLIYVLVLIGVVACRVGKPHLRFVIFVTGPLLLALLIVWGWVIDPRQIPVPHSGPSYAAFTWLKIIACGGILQCLFLPLVEHPAELRGFLERTGLSGSFGTLIMSAIVFLPEVRRRLAIIIDARKSQGYPVSGLSGMLALPATLMPLVSSLLDSATKRAELWSHRGVLQRRTGTSSTATGRVPQAAIVIVVACLACVLAVIT